MKKTSMSYLPVLFILGFAAALGCGAEGADVPPDALSPYADEAQALEEGLPPLETYLETDVLGSTTQAYAAPNAGTGVQYGTRTASSALACTTGSSGQTCAVLRGVTGTVAAKKVDWRLTPAHGFNSTETTAIRNAITALDNTLSGWTFSETAASSAPIQIGKGSAGGSSSSNNIDAFRSLRWDLPADLTEGAGVVGNYQAASTVITLDVDDINARGAVEEAKVAGNQSEVGKLRTHAILSGLMAAISAGTRDDSFSANTYHDRTLVFPGPVFRPLMSAGSQCQMNAFNLFDNGQFNLATPACGD